MPEISVIIPIYNQEVYLHNCLDSICNQSFRDIEVICVDDGSTDRTPEILEEYAKKDERIKIYRQKNQYAGVARNTGMKHASGKYWIFLDSDDFFEEEMLEKMYERAEQSKADIVICEYYNYNNVTKKVIPYDFKFEESFLSEEQDFEYGQLKENGIFQITQGWPWDKLFRADFVKKCGYQYPNIRSSEDGFFVFMLLARAKKISFMKERFITHRVNNANSLSSTKENNWENGFLMLISIYKELKRLGIYEAYEKSFLNFVVFFEIWYLESMNTVDAYEKCYKNIKLQEEWNEKILSYSEEYFYYQNDLKLYKKIVGLTIQEYLFKRNKDYMQKQDKGWIFPYELIEKNKNVVIYGAGAVGTDFYYQLKNSQYCNTLYWVDKRFLKLQEQGEPVECPLIIRTKGIDYVVIAVRDRKVQHEIKKEIIEMGISQERIVWGFD